MASVPEGVGERQVAMVGPPYLYRGAQVCGRRTSRTCIFLLISFGIALCMIGLVLFTADLAMQSGLWAAGVVFIALGVVLLMWFFTLCCFARRSFYALPPSHPARTKSPRPVMLPVATSTPAYQLLPLTSNQSRDGPQGYRASYAGHTDRDLAENKLTGHNREYLDQTGSFHESQPDRYLAEHGSRYSPGQGSYNGTWSYSPRKSLSSYPPQLTASGYGPLDQRPSYPTIQTWDYRLSPTLRYPPDGSSWASLGRHSDAPSHIHTPSSHHGLPSTHTGTYRSENSQVLLQPGTRNTSYTPELRQTPYQRQLRPEDHPPSYLDVIPH